MGGAAYGGHGPGLLAEGWTFAGLATILVLMRVYIRYRIVPHGGWALIWGVVAYLVALVETILSTVAIAYGLGNKFDTIVASGDSTISLKYTYIACLFFDLSLVASKLSAGSFLLSVHAGVYPNRRLLIHFIMISNVILVIPNAITIFLQCDPSAGLWDLELRKSCNTTPFVDYSRFFLIWTGLSDILMSAMAILLIWPLSMRVGLKIILCFLMSLGMFAAATAFLVAYYVGYLSDPDPSYNVGAVFFWGKASSWAVVLAPSVPPVWPLIRPLFGGTDGEASPHALSFRQRTAPAGQTSFFPLSANSDAELGTQRGRRTRSDKHGLQHVEDAHMITKRVSILEMLETTDPDMRHGVHGMDRVYDRIASRSQTPSR